MFASLGHLFRKECLQAATPHIFSFTLLVITTNSSGIVLILL
jgi:hypothetical protein